MRFFFLATLFAFPARAAEPTLEEQARATLPIVAELFGVPAPKALKVQVLPRGLARVPLLKGFERDYPGDALARLGEALIACGLAQPGTDLSVVAPKFYADHFSGFYDVAEHTLVLVSEEPAERQKLIIAHELAHAVQDAQLGLATLFKARRGNEDATLALTAVLEGQAQAVAVKVMERLVPLGNANGVHARAQGIAVASAKELAASAPTPWVGLQLSFPYDAGARWISTRGSTRDPLGTAAWKKIPTTTAQLEWPELQLKTFDFKLARLFPGSKRPWSTSIGHAGLSLLGALEGWRGDRVESVQFRGAAVIVWAVDFDTSAQAEALRAALKGKDVTVRGTTAVLLSNVPAAKRAVVLDAAVPTRAR